MADFVRGRVTAAKVGVGLAIAGLMAGIAERVRQQPADEATAIPSATYSNASAAFKLIAKNSVGTNQIKNHSLLYKDFKLHQVLSYKEHKVIRSLIKGESDLRSEFKFFKSALNGVYNKAQADARFLQGHGGVFSGVQHAQVGNAPATVLQVPTIIAVRARFENVDTPEFQLLNLSQGTLTVSYDKGNGQEQQALVGSGKALPLDLLPEDHLITVQAVGSEAEPVTLTLSFIPDDNPGAGRFVAQALASTP